MTTTDRPKGQQAKVVRINSGKVTVAYLFDFMVYVKPNGDGSRPWNRGPDGYMGAHLNSFAIYDPAREPAADAARARIKALSEQLQAAEQELCTLYREEQVP